MATPDPYLKAGKFGAGLSGYLGAEALANQVLPEGGANAVSTGLMGTGIAQLAEGLGAGKIPLAGREEGRLVPSPAPIPFKIILLLTSRDT